MEGGIVMGFGRKDIAVAEWIGTLNAACVGLDYLKTDERGRVIEDETSRAVFAQIEFARAKLDAVIRCDRFDNESEGWTCAGCDHPKKDAHVVLDVPGSDTPLILCTECELKSIGRA